MTSTVVSRTAKIRMKRSRRLPPGQRLLLYVLLAASVLPALSLPVGITDKNQLPAPTTKMVLTGPFRLQSQMEDVQNQIVQKADKPGLTTALFAIEPKTGRYIDVNAHQAFAAASMIKIPVMVALLVALDKGQVKLDRQMVIRQDLIAGGSGYLQWRPVNSKISLADTMNLMITHSDNTATNMIIDLLGGMETVNREFDSWGMRETRIRNWLADFDGTNTTCPYELACLLGRIDCGELLTPASRKMMFEIMEKTRTRTLLPPGLAPGAKISHKTGDIASMVGDAGIITAPNGVRYIAAVQVTRATRNDRRANALIRELSNVMYRSMTGDNYTPSADPGPKPRRKHSRRHR